MRSKRFVLPIVLALSCLLSCAGSKDVGGVLWGTLGGVTGVSKLIDSFGRNMSANSMLSQALGSEGIKQTKMGLYNSIAKAGGYGIEKGTDLQGALKDKKLDAAGVDAVGSSLTAAASEVGVKSDQVAGLKAIWEPVKMSLTKT